MSLRATLDRWSSRSTIRGAAVISEDGLLVHDAFDDTVDGEAVAALALAVLRHAEQFRDVAGGGELGSVVLELATGPAIVAGLDHRHTLVVLARPDLDLGPLLFDISREKSALSPEV